MNSVGAVIVASGYGGHGKKQNPMEEIDDLNVAVQIVVTFQRAGIKDIVVVCKEEKENLKKVASTFEKTIVELNVGGVIDTKFFEETEGLDSLLLM